MKKVACYARVSTDEQARFGFSIDAQRTALEKYCKENKFNYDFYIDEGISASSINRPALQELLKYIKNYNMIIFTKLDRLSRNVLDANKLNELFQKNNVTIKAIDEDDIDTSTADGMFIFNLKLSLAQREIEKTSERINFVFADKRAKGEITSGARKFGYNIVNKHFEVNEKEAQMIKDLFDYYISVNGSHTKTFEYFQPLFHKSISMMKRYLKDTAYIGKYKLAEKDIYIDNYIPAILDEDTFYKAQKLNKRIEYKSFDDVVSLFGGLCYCNRCKYRMTKIIDRRINPPRVYYKCYRYRQYLTGTTQRGCINSNTISQIELEDYLINNLSELIVNYNVKIESKNKNNSKDNTEKINKIQNKIDKLRNLYLEDLISKDDYAMEYNKYIALLNELKTEDYINISKKTTRKNLDKLSKMNFKKFYSKLNQEQKKAFWFSIIDKIYIENHKVTKIDFA